MKTRIFFGLIVAMVISATVAWGRAQVSIPDPGLEATIRESIQKPTGPLTELDLLSVDVLSACCRDIKTLEGLEQARNVRVLDLHSNSLTNGAVVNALTNLQVIDFFQNQLSSFVLTNGSKLTILDIAFNSLTECSLPSGLANMDTLFLEGNRLINFTLPAGMIALTQLDLSGNALPSLAFPADMTNLASALVFANQITNVVLPGNLKRLASLDLDFNRLRAFSVPESLSNILRLTLLGNQLTNLILPASMTKLGFLDVGDNQIASLKIPAGFTNLNFLRASGNILTNVTLSEGLTNLSAIFLRSNQLSSITLPAGLTHLVQIDLISNRIESLTLPPDIAELLTLGVEGNPLATLTLSDSLAATGLSGTVATLRGQGVSIFTFPIDFRLRPRLGLGGALELTLEGPPGIYSVLDSTNLAIWKSVAAITNQLGSIVFQGDAAEGSPQRFFRAQTEGAHGSMVFISPGTFMMGTAANEMNRQPDEGPQTTVTISRGFWMGKYEVTQREYLAVVGSNPSQFTGDLDRPVETVSWLDATNYCAILTQRELAAGRISVGSRYRLPTEAEWECAARAGASTRFSYGDDPTFTGLRDQAWYSSNSGFGTHPVGQKLPNAWGLYDMEGNVLEWTLDWYGPYSGGSVVDPHGPESNAQGARVIRGGAWDSSGADCRSGRRLTEGVHPFIHDFILGFRVVLVTN